MSPAKCELKTAFLFHSPCSQLGFNCFLPLDSGFLGVSTAPQLQPSLLLAVFTVFSSLVPTTDDCFSTSSSLEGASNVCRHLCSCHSWTELLLAFSGGGCGCCQTPYTTQDRPVPQYIAVWTEHSHAEVEEATFCVSRYNLVSRP